MKKRTRIYVMGNFPHLYLVKIGISNNVGNRRDAVSKSTRGSAFVLFSLSIPYARRVESLIHTICSPLNIKWKGSGKTEWFFCLALIIALPIMLLAAFLEWIALGVAGYLVYKFLFL